MNTLSSRAGAGRGIVFKALRRSNGEAVAIKVMELQADASSLEKEIRLLIPCASPFIVNFLDFCIKDAHICIVMEY